MRVSLLVLLLCVAANVHAKQSQQPIYFKHLKYLEATQSYEGLLSQIMLDEKLNHLPAHSSEAGLIKARLYLQKGMHQSASDVLNKIIDNPQASIQHKNEARFYQGKSFYFQAQYEEAFKLLNQVKEPVSGVVRAERQHLLSLIYMRRGEYDMAASYLRKNWWSPPDNWELYARFNLGVSLIRSGDTKQGIELIKRLGEQELKGDEARAIVDKANQTLGFLLLNRGEIEQARRYLEKVRLHGPYSNLALLGAGWASAKLGEFRQAIIPWNELQNNDIRDIAVQESFLTLPYAYEQLGLNQQSIQLYQKAIKQYQTELQQLDNTMNSLQGKQMEVVLRTLDVTSEEAWHTSIKQASEEPGLRYIQQLINDNEFFNLLISYREARLLEANSVAKIEKISAIQQRLLNRAGLGDRLKSRKNRDQIQFIGILAADLLKRSNEMQLTAQKVIKEIVQHLQRRSLYLLTQRKQELDVYLVQSRLALAQNYDQLKPR